MQKEIELKYLIDFIPETCKTNAMRFYQYYFEFKNSEKLLKELFENLSFEKIVEARVRVIKMQGERQLTLTLKSGESNNRMEYEKQIDSKTARQLLNHKVEGVIEKNRYIVESHNFTFEFDEYLNLKEKLYTVEVELQRELNDETMSQIETVLKDEFHLTFKNVTSDKQYKNKNLACVQEKMNEKECDHN